MQSLGQGSSQSSAKCGTLCRGLDYSGKARSINTFANHQTEVNIDKTVWSLDLSDLDAGQTPTLGRWPNPNTWTRAKPRQHLDWLGCWPNPDTWTLAKPQHLDAGQTPTTFGLTWMLAKPRHVDAGQTPTTFCLTWTLVKPTTWDYLELSSQSRSLSSQIWL
jgi:hypothetical protein